MAFTYDLTTTVGKLRLLIPDRVTPSHLFEDDELTAFYTMEANNVRLGAAAALEAMASDQVMVLKVIRLLDVTTDGAKVSDALLKRAAMLRAQDAALVVATALTLDPFDIAEPVIGDFALRERLYNEALRDS